MHAAGLPRMKTFCNLTEPLSICPRLSRRKVLRPCGLVAGRNSGSASGAAIFRLRRKKGLTGEKQDYNG